MKTLLFIDNVTPTPYDLGTFQTKGMGGTESTVVRIAEALAGIMDVRVEQHNRELSTSFYHPKGATRNADYVIVLRNPYDLIEAKKRFPAAKVYLWCHDLATQALGNALSVIQSSNGIIAVSDWHRTQILESLKAMGFMGGLPIHTVYNPIEDELVPDETAVNRNKLLFVSSPHKGLDHAYRNFKYLLRFNPDFRLYVANPGYLPSDTQVQSAVIPLGTLPYSEVIAQMRSSLCLFFPNQTFPETFGRVLAEANAVGTPTLTHGIGATREVVDRPEQEIVNCNDPKAVVDRVMLWHNGERPTIRGKKQFRLSNVIRSWLQKVLR